MAHGREQPGDAGGTRPVASSSHHGQQHGDRLLRPRAHGHRLAAHQLRRVDDEHVRVGEVLVEGLPGALQQQRVAGGEPVSFGP